MDFLVGGYFLVQASQADWIRKKTWLPARFWTVSGCICKIYPDTWIFSWTSKSMGSPHHYQETLKLDEEGFKSLQAWADEMFKKEELGWPNVFLNIETARQFYAQYLKHLPDIKLLSIALSEPYRIEFIEENKPKPGMGEGGVYQKLLQRQLLDPTAITRGFEILGDEWGGQFHSFFCNSLDTDYKEQLNISLNQYGLIDRYEEAVRAADYTSLDEVKAEPALWQPWLISEYPIPT
jgi:hypothetical protein